MPTHRQFHLDRVCCSYSFDAACAYATMTLMNAKPSVLLQITAYAFNLVASSHLIRFLTSTKVLLRTLTNPTIESRLRGSADSRFADPAVFAHG